MNSIRNLSLVNLLTLIEAWLEHWENEYEEIESTEQAVQVLRYVNTDFIIDRLGCSFRTAYDYKNAIIELAKILHKT